MAPRTPGDIVRQRREELGISRERLAVDLNIHSSTIGRLERGQLPTTTTMVAIAKALGLSLDEIVGIETSA